MTISRAWPVTKPEGKWERCGYHVCNAYMPEPEAMARALRFRQQAEPNRFRDMESLANGNRIVCETLFTHTMPAPGFYYYEVSDDV